MEGIAQLHPLFDTHDGDLFLHQDVQDLHEFHQPSTEAAALGHQQGIVRCQLRQELAEDPLSVGLRPAPRLCDPPINMQRVLISELKPRPSADSPPSAAGCSPAWRHQSSLVS